MVDRVTEKPSKPKSKFAILPLYVFNSSIYEALEKIRPDKNEEIQLTDAIQQLIEDGCRVQALKLRRDEIRLDIGTPEYYWEALAQSHRFYMRVR